jgi:predicted RNA-binding protein associated with RNAse of E/G family
MQKNIALLKEMSQKLQPKNLPSANAANSLHTDIDELISNALAKNRISSNQAEAYYLKLAQIESNLESTKTGQVSNEKTAMDKSLNQLRIELLHKVN